VTGERTDAAVGEPRVAEPTPGHPFDELRTPPFIRPYRRDDRDAVFEICLRTAAGGGDATGVYSDDALMPEVFALPYVEYDPGLAFVVDDGYGRALGYIIGVADTRAFVDWWGREWGPAFRTRHPHAPSSARRARGRGAAPRHGSGEHGRAGVLRPARLPRAAVEQARRSAAGHRDELTRHPCAVDLAASRSREPRSGCLNGQRLSDRRSNQ